MPTSRLQLLSVFTTANHRKQSALRWLRAVGTAVSQHREGRVYKWNGLAWSCDDVGMQHTIHAGYAIVIGTALVEELEEASGMCAAHTPAHGENRYA